MGLVIADLHGRADLLEGLLAHVPTDTSLVFVGDAIDRGPRNRDTIRLLTELHEAGRMVLLRGNHEGIAANLDAAIERLHDCPVETKPTRQADALAYFQNWWTSGGDVVVREYGGPDSSPDTPDGFGDWGVPPELMAYINRTQLLYRHPHPEGDILVSHAAPPLHLPGYRSLEEMMMWARPEEGPWPLPSGVRLSVHGHTPVPAPTQLGQHVFIDLGAVWSGVLATYNLETGQIRAFARKGGMPLQGFEALPTIAGLTPVHLPFEVVYI
jgi:serine/threonine protein phosphatase 1